MNRQESMDYKHLSETYADLENFNNGAVAAALGVLEIVAVCGTGWA